MLRTKNINVNVQRPPTNIPLGRQGENLATCIIFDCTGLVQLYGDGTAELLHELKSGTVYPVAIQQDGASVSWTVSASDTANIGSGRAELRWYVGDTLAKSAKFRTSVSSALPDTSVSTPPAPYQSWVDQVLQAAQEIKDGAILDEKLAEAIAAYLEEHPIDAGLDEAALAEYLTENGYLTDAALADAITQALADAKASGEFDGEPGKDGVDGSPGADGADGVGIQSVEQTTTSTGDGGTNVITVTKTDGSTSTFEVRNGSKGNDGAPGKDGTDGAPGADGKTPVYGTDYGTTEQIAEIAQSAAEVLQPEVSQIKNDLANKLPKSPTNWEPWTAEEQAAARERIGIPGDYVLIETIEITDESITRIIRNKFPNGKPYNLRSIAIGFYTPKTEVSKSVVAMFSTDVDEKKALYFGSFSTNTSYEVAAKASARIISGIVFVDQLNSGRNDNGYTAYTSMITGAANKIIKSEYIRSLRFDCSNGFPVGTRILIYGVRS